MTIYKPPTSISDSFAFYKRIFLAGSIEMGKASNWQNIFCENYSMKNSSTICVYNPRRDNWDPTWEQTPENPHFYQQVNWELQAMDAATHIIMYLEPGTISPISLLELGIYKDSKKLTVICPDGFHRKGNVDIVCTKYGIQLYNDFNQALYV